MQQKLEAFRATKRGTSSPAAVTEPIAAPVETAPQSDIQMELERYRSEKGTATPRSKQPKKESLPVTLAKSLFTAPATMVARPFQAVQGAYQYGRDKPAIDQGIADLDTLNAEGDALYREIKSLNERGQPVPEDLKARIKANQEKSMARGNTLGETSSIRPFSGGIVAPAPENFADVKKDVGRGIQTVALGTGAPIAGGAAFGLGSSLEQGNDLLSVQTAVNTVLGGAGGKVLEWVGKPLFNAAGKVIGKIAPETLIKLAAKGPEAIARFARENQLLGGAFSKTGEVLSKGFQGVDDTIGNATSKLFKGAGEGTKNFIGREYPSLSKKGLEDRFVNIEKENFAKPSTISKAGYKKSAEIYKNAKEQGTDLGEVAVNNKIQHDKLIDGKNYATVDTADQLRADAMKASHDLIRPALAAAEPGVALVPISTVRNRMLAQVDNIPNTKIAAAERDLMKRKIAQRYADDSAEAAAHPQGYKLTDFHDGSILKNMEGKYKPNGTMSDNFAAQQAREEGTVFRDLLESNSPKEIKIGDFKRELQKRFQLADYLESLHGKRVPQGIVGKAVDLLGKVVGASAGANLGGGYGGIVGYHLGGVLFDSFEHMSNPLKAKVLNALVRENPPVFNALVEYIGKEEAEKLLRLKLPAAGGSSFKEPVETLFSTPEGKATPNFQEAIDVTAVEKGSAKRPSSGMTDSKVRKIREFFEAQEPYDANPPTIKAGRKQKLTDIYKNLPTIKM